MKKRPLLFCALIAFAALALSTSVVWAEEEGKSAAKAEDGKETPKEGGKDAAKGGEEEGGGKKKGPTDVSGGRFAGDPVYVHLAPMVLPVISDAGAEQIITMQIDVEVKDFDVADSMHTNMPRVVDALMRALYGGLGQGSLRRGKLVDVTRVKNKAQAALDEVIPGGGVVNVLIQGVSQRML